MKAKLLGLLLLAERHYSLGRVFSSSGDRGWFYPGYMLRLLRSWPTPRQCTPDPVTPGLTGTGIHQDHVTHGAPAIGLDLRTWARLGLALATTVTVTTAAIGAASNRGAGPRPALYCPL